MLSYVAAGLPSAHRAPFAGCSYAAIIVLEVCDTCRPLIWAAANRVRHARAIGDDPIGRCRSAIGLRRESRAMA